MRKLLGLIIAWALLLAPLAPMVAEPLKQSTAVTIWIGQFTDATDRVTPETGLAAGTVDGIVAMKAGATSQTDLSGTTTFTHRAGGWYTLTLSTADTGTLGPLTVGVWDTDTSTPAWRHFTVVPANEYDSLVAGTDALEVDSVAVNGATPQDADDVVDAWETQSQADPTGFHVNVLEVGGTAQTANDNGADINAILLDTGTDGVVLANDAITAAKIATGAIGADEIATNAIGADELAANAIGASEIADNAIDAGAIAANALGASELATDAAQEIQAGVSVDEIQATALADLFNTDSGTNYAGAVAGSAVKEIADNAGGSALTESGIADAVWNELATGHTDAGKAGAQLWTDVDAILTDTDALPSAAAIKTALEAEGTSDLDLIADAITNGGYGLAAIEGLVDELETRLTALRAGYLDELAAGNMPADLDAVLLDTAEIGTAGAGLTNIDLPNQTMNITGNITGNLSGSVGSVTGAVGSVTGAVGSVTGNVGGNVTGSVGSVAGNVDGNVTGTVGTVNALAADSLTASALNANLSAELLAAWLALALEGSLTVQEALQTILSFAAGETTGGGTATINFYDQNGAVGGNIQLQMTVDADGDRSATSIEP